MKISKKLIATAAMAAICCMLSMPIAAGAGTGTGGAAPASDPGTGAPLCPPHHMVKRNEQYDVTKTEHEYIFAYVYNEDGTLDHIIRYVCYVTNTYHQYNLGCTLCGMLLLSQGPGRTITHSSCGNPDEHSLFSIGDTQTE